MLSFNEVACRRDGNLLFDGASFVVHRGQKVGLTGANGTGKSSLFSMVGGTLEPDAGEVSLQNDVGITHVLQETPSSERTALDHVLDGDVESRRIEREMEVAMNDSMRAAGGDEGDRAAASVAEEAGNRYATLLARYDELDGWSARARAGALLNGLGFRTVDHDRPVSDFSGGWRMRINLAQALMSPNELLLLDEPTNHLDLDAVMWLEQWLVQRAGTLLLVSHDREFLDAVTSQTLHIEKGAVTLVSGNYSAFERWRAARRAGAQAQHVKQAKRRKELEGFVARFRAKASKARQAQSRLKMLERMGETEAVRDDSPFRFAFRAPEALPAPLVDLQQVRLGYGGPAVLDGVRFAIASGDRIGLLGQNGAGKSTLVKALVGDLVPENGTRVTADKLRIGYFAQHQVDQLDAESTAFRVLVAADRALDETRARTFLGGFGFTGDQVHQRIGTLSGGERARLALSLIVHSRPNLLLLDEPTNHLDIEMRRALADALQGFEGGLVVISHDRTMLRSVVDELMLVARGRVAPFDDDLDGYARWLSAERALQAKAASADATGGGSVAAKAVEAVAGTCGQKPGKGGARDRGKGGARDRGKEGERNGGKEVERDREEGRGKRRDAEVRARLAPLKKSLARDERELEAATKALEVLRKGLADTGLYEDARKDELGALLEQEAAARGRVDAVEDAVLEAMQALENAGSEQGSDAADASPRASDNHRGPVPAENARRAS